MTLEPRGERGGGASGRASEAEGSARPGGSPRGAPGDAPEGAGAAEAGESPRGAPGGGASLEGWARRRGDAGPSLGRDDGPSPGGSPERAGARASPEAPRNAATSAAGSLCVREPARRIIDGYYTRTRAGCRGGAGGERADGGASLPCLDARGAIARFLGRLGTRPIDCWTRREGIVRFSGCPGTRPSDSWRRREGIVAGVRGAEGGRAGARPAGALAPAELPRDPAPPSLRPISSLRAGPAFGYHGSLVGGGLAGKGRGELLDRAPAPVCAENGTGRAAST